MKQASFFAAIITLVIVLTNVASADVPQLISFQGKLHDNAGEPLTGQYEITFRIYSTEEGGTALWTETSEVNCENGLYYVILGTTTPLIIDFDEDYWLSVQIGDDEELFPRFRIVSVPMAIRASVAGTAQQVSWNNITDVPEGFADGTDDVGETGGISQINEGTGITVTNPTGPTASIAHAADASAMPNAHHTKTTSAIELTSGTLDNERFSAYDDLNAEGKVGTGADQVAEGDHDHDDDYVSKVGPDEMTGDSPEFTLKVVNSGNGHAVYGEQASNGTIGILGELFSGVYGQSNTTVGVDGYSSNGCAVHGRSETGRGIYGYSTSGWSGWFYGKTYMSGNVGIGTENPNRELHVNGDINAEGYLRVNDQAAIHATDGNHQIQLGSTNSSRYTTIVSDFGEVIRVAADGRVGIGTTIPGYKLDVAGQAHATSFPTSSDARFKKDVTQLSNVLEKLDTIRGVSFEWNEQYESLGRSTGHREIGVIAQEVESVFPELVTEWGDDNYRAVDYGRFAGVFIEAIKELKAENEILKQRIDAFETKLEE